MRRLFNALFGRQDPPPTASPTLAIDLPFEMIVVPGQEAPAVREQLLAKGGSTPVIMGNEDDIQLMVEAYNSSGESIEGVLDAASRLDLEAWMQALVNADSAFYCVDPGEWPQRPNAPAGLSVHLDVLSRRPKKNVLIGLFPPVPAWQLPAHLRYGGWNACPEPAAHVALHRKWHEAHGSQIACISSDVIECTVERPPRTREAALQLAREQFLYCPDIVHQGAQSLEGLAATLLGAQTWYFWWD